MKNIFKVLIVLLLIIVGVLAVLMIQPINIGVAIAFGTAITSSLILNME